MTDILEFRTIDGTENHPEYLGALNTQLIRLFNNAYEDGISIPRGGDFGTSSLPNPRTISNAISTQSGNVPNFLGASDWLWQWGQFIDHDLDLNEANGEFPAGPDDATPIFIPPGDPTFTDVPFLPFTRVPAAAGTGIDKSRETINQITAFIDASSVYGSDEERAHFLRSFDNGQLKVSTADNGETLLTLNGVGDDALPNATGGLLGDFQFIAGDARANEQIGLTAVHTLFVREHNRLAAELSGRLATGDVELVALFEAFAATSEGADPAALQDEFLYQAARRVVGAQVQKITYEEFLPLLIGNDTLAAYSGYDDTIDPSISTEFANAAYRLGHTMLSNQLQFLSENGFDQRALGQAFFVPQVVQAEGVDTSLRGLIFQAAQQVDNLVVDGVRNSLFAAPGFNIGLDLAAINIARGRETGLPGYVEVYNQLFPESPLISFEDLPFQAGLGGNDGLFAQVYGDISEIDLWLGGISEAPDGHGGLLGPTFSAIVADQFGRTRDGDRFFYLDDLDTLAVLDPDFGETTLSEIIRSNSDLPFLVPDDAFSLPYDNSFLGDAEDNTLVGTNGADLIQGGTGDDFIQGRKAADILIGDTGNDVLQGDAGQDTLLGGVGDDFLMGNRGQDVLLGGDGNDILRGGRGKDILIGGTGNDVLRGDGGPDLLNGVGEDFGVNDFDELRGGAGRDTFLLGEAGQVFYEGAGVATLVNFNRNQDIVQLVGSASDYVLAKVGGETQLSLADGGDLIAVFDNKTVNTFDKGFTFV